MRQDIKEALKDFEDQVSRRVTDAVARAIREDSGTYSDLKNAKVELTRLQEETEKARIEKSRRDEEFEKRERELRHEIGLERKRQEFEITQATRETTVSVREENLTADRARFEEQMRFTHERFAKEVDYLKEIMGEILLRLPTVNVDRAIDLGSKTDVKSG